MANKIKKVIIFFIKLFIKSVSLLIFILPGIFFSLIYFFFKPENKNSKILLGINEIANNLNLIRDCLIKDGYKITLITTNNKFYEAEHKFQDLNKIIKITTNRYFHIFIEPFYLPFLFLKNYFSHNIHFYVWNKSFYPAYIDFFLIKLSKKKLIIMHCGDDVRYRPIQRIIDNEFGLTSWINAISSNYTFVKNFYFQKISEITGNVISIRDQSTFQSKPSFYFKVPMLELSKSTKTANKIIKIMHAPSDPEIKGTNFVYGAIQILKNKNLNFEFTILSNVPNKEILKQLKNTDILIDQPSTWIGRLGMEACASGCCVIGGNQNNYMGIYDSPVIQFQTNSMNLAIQLENLINNTDFLQEKMNSCYAFWKNNYSYESFKLYFKQIINNQAPTFKPLPNHKAILISSAENIFQKLLIQVFY
jgi:hypothetical protein